MKLAEVARRQSTETLQKLYDGKLRLERRNGGSKIYARTFMGGKSLIHSTRELTLHAATKIATDWYLDLRDRLRKGENLHGKSFAAMAKVFLEHADHVREVSEGQRRNYKQKWNLLKPHFDGVKVTDVDARFLLALRETRSQAKTRDGKLVKPATLKKEPDRKMPRRNAGVPLLPRRSVGGHPVPAPLPRSRAVGEGPQAGQGPRRRTRSEPAQQAAAAGAVLVHADIRRRRVAGRGGV